MGFFGRTFGGSGVGGSGVGGASGGGFSMNGGNTGAMNASGGAVPMQGTGVQPSTFQTGGFQYKAAPSAPVNTQAFAPAQMPNMSVAPGETYQKGAQDAYWNQATSRLDPQWQQRMDSEQSRLANMGFSGDSAARSQDMGDLYRSRNDAYGSAMNSAILNSGAEGQRRQGMDIAAGQFGNQATQQNFENQLTGQAAQNAAQNQQFGQNMQGAQLNNAGLGAQQNAAQGWGNIALGWGNQANSAASIRSQNQLGNRGYDISQSQHEFDNSRQQAFDPYLLQNLAMGGMNPNDPSFTGNTNPSAPGQLGYAAQQTNANNQIGAGVSDFTGKFLNSGLGSMGGNYLKGLGNSFSAYQPGGFSSVDSSMFGP